MKIQIATAVLTGILSLIPASPALAASIVSVSAGASVTMLNARDLMIKGASEAAPIQLRFAGAERLEPGTASGELLVTRHGWREHYRPEVYQIVNGKERRLTVSYTLSGDDRVTVNFGNYDNGAPIFLRGGATTR